MLAFSQASRGKRIAVEAQAGDINLSCYAVSAQREVKVTLINKESAREAAVNLRCKGRIQRLRR
jgi:hypothetical protein